MHVRARTHTHTLYTAFYGPEAKSFFIFISSLNSQQTKEVKYRYYFLFTDEKTEAQITYGLPLLVYKLTMVFIMCLCHMDKI